MQRSVSAHRMPIGSVGVAGEAYARRNLRRSRSLVREAVADIPGAECKFFLLLFIK